MEERGLKERYTNVQALDYSRNTYNIFDSCDNEHVSFELVFDDECPLCGYGMDMGKDAGHKFHDISSANQTECNVACIHLCPHCHQLFVTEHKMLRCRDDYKELIHKVFPYVTVKPDIPDEIKNVSERFVNLLGQAYSAKQYGLVDIYGMALRKAFECLVKDFALFNNQGSEDEIAGKTLAVCINDYIESEKIKVLCTSCRMIGNNETHWKNDNTPEDLALMERIIKAVIHFIEQEMVVLEAEAYNNAHLNK